MNIENPKTYRIDLALRSGRRLYAAYIVRVADYPYLPLPFDVNSSDDLPVIRRYGVQYLDPGDWVIEFTGGQKSPKASLILCTESGLVETQTSKVNRLVARCGLHSSYRQAVGSLQHAVRFIHACVLGRIDPLRVMMPMDR